jgi:D-glycero-alpha-D-manno-heptose 1-phosphate guanylyltransferase
MLDITDNSIPHFNGREAIILAGGLGTRLREAVPDLPKCMAPVAGRPFLFYVINYLRSQGVQRFIFSLGYKHEVILDYLEESFASLSYTYVVEDTPLGTGGAIALALTRATQADVLITNGDTLFKLNADELYQQHANTHALCTLSLKPMQHFERYGVVTLNTTNQVTAFKEKQYYDNGLINGGCYLLQVAGFQAESWPEKFSFETDFLEKQYPQGQLYGIVQEGYFIDIGIPADYTQAQTDLGKPTVELKDMDASWTIFLDRDGVFNHDKVGSYVFTPDEFRLYDGALEAIKIIGEKFGLVLVATNQRGVGKGLMTVADLHAVHAKMKEEIEAGGGRIDHFYYATDISNFDPMRKPNPGMAFAAKRDFPQIDMNKAVMVGNNPSDMQMGRNAGLYTVYLTTTNPPYPLPHPEVDWQFETLEQFAKAL